jgi:hypothetical protein
MAVHIAVIYGMILCSVVGDTNVSEERTASSFSL